MDSEQPAPRELSNARPSTHVTPVSGTLRVDGVLGPQLVSELACSTQAPQLNFHHVLILAISATEAATSH
ncbi:hypothetical protein SeLEV6574_g02451 [Synchytrium endobioticum]|uniref:Uncharacterized protein n=1 Tax=Synchytrium endobioticum TaxID=286115 RepID=A0A507D8G0_9FUNG|nr:hypothetical protein SeLEV6574_g02451 [Synchytrium endobioticum]